MFLVFISLKGYFMIIVINDLKLYFKIIMFSFVGDIKWLYSIVLKRGIILYDIKNNVCILKIIL